MIVTFLLLILLSTAAGFIGALLGLGGGIILVPGLTLLFNFDVKVAIAASIISVIATSASAATVYIRQGLTNIRLGLLLEIATAAGAIAGGMIAVHISGRYLYFLFAAVLVYAGVNMMRGRRVHIEPSGINEDSTLDGSYVDPITGRTVSYMVIRVPTGMAVSIAAGIISSMLGVGGGIIKVPLMNIVMHVPMRAAIATSSFMIGVTAATGAFVYWTSGLVNPAVVAPSVIGVLIGARAGTMAAGKLRARALTKAFVLLIAVMAVQMVLEGLER
ncbi:MAG: sulfite exporter TauE/SafE family protein [Armatimonadetes bacterium]|nr:sulfite exporter TauE/SafE family protein [Armatimonadota bacterium]